MKEFLTFKISVGYILGLLIVPSLAFSAIDPGQEFNKRCSSCHTIGGGILKGPDLKGITERRQMDWLVKFVKSSDAMIQSGDPTAVKLYNEFNQIDMPDVKLSEEDIRTLLEFIGSGQQLAAATKSKSALDATAQDIAMGQEIFLGARPLANGGPACVSCHSVGGHGPLGGGTLAKNLSNAYSSYKDEGLATALKNVAFPVMSEVYGKKKLTDEEIFQLKSFLYQADKDGPSPLNFQKKFVFLGLGGVVITMGIIDFSWRKRRKQSVRKKRGGIR